MPQADDYFSRIRARPYDQAAERARAVRDPAFAMDPQATIGAVRQLGRTAREVAIGAANGPLDAIDTATRKLGGVANWAVDRVTGGGSGFYGQPMKLFPDLDSPRLLPEIPGGDEESVAGGLARGVTTFMTLYGPMAGQLAAAGASGIASSMAAGAFADMMAFENKTGTLADVLRSLGIDNEFTQSLSGQLSDNEWEASLKAALEGAALGTLGPVISGIRAGVRRWPQYGESFLQRVKAGPPSGSLAAQRGSVGPDDQARQKPGPGQPGSAGAGLSSGDAGGRGDHPLRPGGKPGVFARSDTEDDRRLRLTALPDQQPLAVYSDGTERWAELPADEPVRALYSNQLRQRVEADAIGRQVTPLSPEQLANHRLFMTAEGDAGAAVSPTGEVVALFKNEPTRKGVARAALEIAVKNGGTHLNAYAPTLPKLYAPAGFEEVARVKFSREEAPPGWDYSLLGEPDLVFMRYNPAAVGKPHVPGSNYVTSYDEGLAIARGDEP